jgi:formiminoglutamate deiminase
MTTAIFSAEALLPDGWRKDVRVSLVGNAIDDVSVGAVAQPGDVRVQALIPGLSNLHSHTFQRAMAGLSERRGSATDSFWTWRDMMYRFALALTPDEVQAIAEMAAMEMLEAGFTRLGEFHYLHHAPDDRPYADASEMSQRILAAATATGIHLTLLPVFYAHSDFGGVAPLEGQRRFVHDLDCFCRLTDRMGAALTRPLDRIGIAPHSLRAATEAELSHLLDAHPRGPVHIHVAEQVREVEDSLAWSGQRPVERLLSRFPVDDRWCLIHATHLTEAERQRLAASGAVVGLCPVTEASLGDGLFPAREYLAEAGRIGIGTDSNIDIGVAAELRLLEYGQRLFHRLRNVLSMGEGSTGDALVRAALSGGAQALGAPEPLMRAGAPADLVALSDPLALPAAGGRVLDRWIFGRDVRVSNVWAGGAQVVTAGRHRDRDRIAPAFARAVAAVVAR